MTPAEKLMVVFNKADVSGEACRLDEEGILSVYLSAKTGEGVDLLKQAIRQFAGINASIEGRFIARRRHLDALNKSLAFLHAADEQLNTHRAGELVAEELKNAHQALEEITGAYSADDLLGEIFASFCIGK